MSAEARAMCLQLIAKRLIILERLSDVYPDIPVVENEKMVLLATKQELMEAE